MPVLKLSALSFGTSSVETLSRLFFSSISGLLYHMNTFSAMLGFQQMEIETILFTDKEELINTEVTDIVVGGVGKVKQFLENKGIIVKDIDYPKCLSNFYGRKIW